VDDPLIPAIVGLCVLSALFAVLALRFGLADRRRRRDAVAERLRRG
jgi:hypothetical protein